MPPTLVQSKRAAGNGGTSASVTGLTTTVAGNLLVLLVDAWNNPGNVTFTPPAGWTQAGTTTQDDVFISGTAAQYYYTNNPGGITSVAVTLSAAASAWHIEVLEFSGVATTTPLDVQSFRQQSGTTTPSSGAVTTTAAGDLLVGWMAEDDVNGAYTLTQPAGWTALPRQQDTNAWASLYSAYQVAGAAGSYNYNPTLTATQTDSIVGIMAFKAAGGGVAVSGSATLSGGSNITVAGKMALHGASTFSSQGNLTTKAQMALHGSTTLSGGSNLVVAGLRKIGASIILIGQSILAVAGVRAMRGSATLSGSSNLIATPLSTSSIGNLKSTLSINNPLLTSTLTSSGLVNSTLVLNDPPLKGTLS